jgi:hypothetical protein
MAAYMANEAVGRYIDEGFLMTKDSVDGLLSKMAERMDGIERDFKLGRKHNDFDSVIESKDYKSWVAEQSKPIKKLSKSDDPEDVAYVLNAYKEHAEAEKKNKASSATKEKKAKVDALHSGSLRSKQIPGKKQQTPKSDADEFIEEFYRDEAD